jgi:hypothetical protein
MRHAIIAVELLFACAACGGDDTYAVSFSDTRGRTCSGECAVSGPCDYACMPVEPPFSCPADQNAVWVVRGTAANDQHLQVCGGCQKGGITGYVEPTCAEIVCDSDDNCNVIDMYVCRSQRCVPR